MKGNDVSKRAKSIDHMHSYCRVVGCPHPARAGSENGLDRRFCRKHSDHYGRHGSPYKSSYRAADLTPHRRKVKAWLKQNADHAYVSNAIQRVNGLYERSGTHTEAFRLAGMSPAERARKAWARLRESSAPPLKVIEAWLVVSLAIQADPQPVETVEFKRVQAAKLVHRLASGSHKRWVRQANLASGPSEVLTELHKYPHSRGRVLRELGRDIEEACELAVQLYNSMHNSTSPGGVRDRE